MCGTDQVCCGTTCCPSGQTCQNGVCAASDPCAGVSCPACQTCSNGASVAVRDGVSCPGGVCSSGACGTPCGPYTCTPCQTCVNLNGGFCGDICTDGCKCSGGAHCGADGRCHLPNGGGCFVAGTRVSMADGTSRPIELVALGDRVLGRDGVNRVLDIVRPILGERPLYAVNGSAPFVTAGHPFLTAAGWKAIDPTAAEVPGLAAGRLTVGDRLLALAGVAVPAIVGGDGVENPEEVRVEAVPLHNLTMHAADSATPLFNLRVDGDHTYVANDWLVHNKPF